MAAIFYLERGVIAVSFHYIQMDKMFHSFIYQSSTIYSLIQILETQHIYFTIIMDPSFLHHRGDIRNCIQRSDKVIGKFSTFQLLWL